MSSFSCSEPQDRKHIDFIQMKSLINVSTLVRFDKIQLKSGSSGQSPLPQYHCRPSLPGWGASSTHSPRPSWRNENIFYLDVGWQNTFYIHVSITWKTSGRPREGCGPNDPGVQPRLRRLQARTLGQIFFNLYHFKSYLNHLTQAKWPSQAARCKAVLPEKVVILGSWGPQIHWTTQDRPISCFVCCFTIVICGVHV